MTSKLTVVLVSLLLATPGVAFWLWLVIVPARVTILCPEKCECDTAGYSIICSSKSLTAVPSIHLRNVQALWLSDNNITLLEKDSFVSMTELKLLDVTECELRTIELGAFNGLTELTALFMWNNKISEIMPGSFEKMSSLEYLDLSKNKIKHLNSAVFSGLGTFSGLTKLTRLSVLRNEIGEIFPSTFQNMSSVEYLDLCNNKIKHLISVMLSGLGALNGLKKLTRLSMVRNEISEIFSRTFQYLCSLEYLNLSNNKIKHLYSAMYRGLGTFS